MEQARLRNRGAENVSRPPEDKEGLSYLAKLEPGLVRRQKCSFIENSIYHPNAH